MMLKTIALLLFGTIVTEAQMNLSSPNFENQQPIPKQHPGEGADASPALKWEGAPSSTKSFALIVDDPDAPVGTWVHWVIYNIPAGTSELPAGVAKADTVAGMKQGVNDFGRVGYNGPMPPRGHGKHRYFFKLYALKTMLDLPARATKSQLEAAMKGQILAQAELVGTYERR
jgi:Raf kinase inhibitor-like YbhB/YbcL family protein